MRVKVERLERTLVANGVGEARGKVGLHVGQGDVVVRALGTRQARDDGRQVELEHVGEDGVLRGVGVIAEEALGLEVRLDVGDLLVRTTGETQVVEGLVVDGEVADRGAHLRGHVGDGGPVFQRKKSELEEKNDKVIEEERI